MSNKILKENVSNSKNNNETQNKSKCCSSKNHNNLKKEVDKDNAEKNEKLAFAIKFGISVILFTLSLVLNVSDKIKLVIIIIAAAVSGYELLFNAVKNVFKGEIFDENALMLIASVTAFILGEQVEGILIILLYNLGEFLEDIATDRSREKIAGLSELKSTKVTIIIDGEYKNVDPENVDIGSVIFVKKGERVPIDGKLLSDNADLDLKAVTGESKLFEVIKNDDVFSGSINVGNGIKVLTTKLYKDSTVEKIINMVERSTERKAKSQKFITSFSKIYTPCIVFLAILLSVIPPLFDGYNFSRWIYKGLSFLIISCPCALVISVPLGFFIGIGSMAKRGVLVKGSNYIDALSKVNIAVFDKTGTLTNGKFSVIKCTSISEISENEIIKIAASLEQSSLHPIAKAISSCAENDIYTVSNLSEIAGKGISGIIHGERFFVGKSDNLEKLQLKYGESIVFLMRNDKTLGYIVLSDTLKKESKYIVSELKKVGVNQTVIISGDVKDSVKNVASKIGVDNAFYQLLPNEKADKLSKIIENNNNGTVLYCGDGINDSPSIAMADVGVAMGTIGSGAAIDCSDVVITDDNLLKIPFAIKRAKLIKRKVIANIAISLAVKIAIMTLSIFTTIPVWLALFSDVGVMLLAVLNSLSIGLYK